MKCFIDFEFTSSAQPDVDVVCAVLQTENSQPISYWLFRSDESKSEFAEAMKRIEGHTLVAFGALAECRALRSLGIDPLKYQWIDLYVEWRQLKNHHDRFNFGWVKDSSGHVVLSKPYSILHDCHLETSASLAGCVLALLKLDIDLDQKNLMRDLILSKGSPDAVCSPQERQDILRYCAEDVRHLPKVLQKMSSYYAKHFDMDRGEIMKKRGRFIAALSGCEHLGTPLDMKSLNKLSANYDNILRDVYQSMNKVYPLYEETGKDFRFKSKLFKDLILELKLENEWPRTESGLLATDSESIEKYRSFPQIEKLFQSRKIISSMRAIKIDAQEKLMSRIGRDQQLRSFFGPLGTQTGRNAAKASHFILGMSNWLRILIMPSEGTSITGVDYSSQEFAIAAALSEDSNMREAYNSGDPYLYFGKKAGAIPADGTKNQFKRERDLFKSTTLGLQYGMASKSLARKLTHDIGRIVTIEEAESLIELHQKIYPEFWMWSDYCWNKYLRDGCLETSDGWVLFGHNSNSLSVKNFLVQGTGASIMRRALILATETGLDVMAPLHDALYIIHDQSDKKAVDTLQVCMRTASREFVDIDIRMDAKTFDRTTPWIEEKGRADYERFKKYLA